MNKDKLYFYKRTIRPKESDDFKYYLHGQGIAGFKTPQHKGELILHGTVKELMNYLKENANSKNLSNNGFNRRAVSKGRLY